MVRVLQRLQALTGDNGAGAQTGICSGMPHEGHRAGPALSGFGLNHVCRRQCGASRNA